MDKLEYNTLINYCLRNRYPDDTNKAPKRHIILQSNSFKCEGAGLYRITKPGTVRKATRSDEVDEIIRRIHFYSLLSVTKKRYTKLRLPILQLDTTIVSVKLGITLTVDNFSGSRI